ncbi:cytochrome b-c1 complex subunit 2, mitochondrial [Chrysoperla carnea]|uniref:cytochrome b-c1 complex subunit 2, mitochondrial n=1 Tax=Chrysoperla carnea TaxID=189513 RepID=UPI001D0672D5|nr:cytochrome b-c1 complex subunit 2, mitochondrial [Chrysoperla carnea]
MMACKASSAPFLRNIVVRSYSAQAAPALSCSKLEQTTLPNKIVVASVASSSPLARVSVLFKAGSRYESPEEAGLAHALRIAAGLTTAGASKLAITRTLQKLGANLTATSDRESITYTLEGTRDAVEHSLNILREVATQQVFKPWEIHDNLSRIQYEITGLANPVRAIDILHKAAFRQGLGNSLFCSKSRISKINGESLCEYVSKTFTAPRAAVAGVGMDLNSLVAFANDLQIESSEGPAAASKYYGGELRKESGGQLAHVAIAGQGASLKDTKAALAAAVLQQALGAGPSIKWGSSAGNLVKAVTSAAGKTPVAVTALNAEYSDNGLIGALVSCPAEAADGIVRAAVSALKSINVSDADIQRGKALLKANVLDQAESGRTLVEEIGQQALLLGKVTSAKELAQAIDSVSQNDVLNVASKLKSGKLSVGAVGNLTKVPYADEC